MQNIELRFADETDAKELLELITELAVYENLSELVTANEQILISALFKNKRAKSLLAEVDGRVVGYAIFFYSFSTFLGKGGIYIEDVFVKPDFRGMGIGKLFFKKIASLAIEDDCKRLEWSCLDWNKPSIDFYLSLGAEQMNEWTTYRLSGDKLNDLANGCF